MKNIFKQTIALLSLLFWANAVMGQAPQDIPYQAIARNSAGAILASQAISVRFTIHDATAGGAVVYTETFSPTTTALGLFSVNVGTGTVVSGTFSGINWGTNAKYMQVEMDPAGGTSYVDMGTQQMMSVPYALYSNNGVTAGTTTGDMLYWNGSSWVRVTAGSNGQVLRMNGSTPTWTCPSAPAAPAIGTPYQGGVVAYILQPGDPGYDACVPHGLIAATADQSTGIVWWNGSNTTTGATGTAIGTGLSNTNLIIANQGTGSYAASICKNYTGGGYTDWYLPSKDELNGLYINMAAIGGFSFIGYYWSSSEADNQVAFDQHFFNGSSLDESKNTADYVRAVRAF